MSTTTTNIDNTARIQELLRQLAATTNQADKKKLRRALRALGHRGGLRVTMPAAVSAPKPPALHAIPAGESDDEPELELELEPEAPKPSKKPSKKAKK